MADVPHSLVRLRCECCGKDSPTQFFALMAPPTWRCADCTRPTPPARAVDVEAAHKKMAELVVDIMNGKDPGQAMEEFNEKLKGTPFKCALCPSVFPYDPKDIYMLGATPQAKVPKVLVCKACHERARNAATTGQRRPITQPKYP